MVGQRERLFLLQLATATCLLPQRSGQREDGEERGKT